tara:strand:+ start:137 stop:418 length:282 start_codon:yes stop_codon:yes gene_type:complete
MTFSKGDLVGCKIDDAVSAYVITQVIRAERFYFAYSIFDKRHRFLVHDPETVFLICPQFNPDIEPDADMQRINTEMYDALDRLFGFVDEDTDD